MLKKMLSRSFTAVTVMLAATGCGNMGPNIPQTDLEHLRQFKTVGAPLNRKLSYFQSAQTLGVPVIYVHGTPGSAQAWANYVERPIDGSYSIAMDRPGFGQSTPELAVTSLSDQAAAVLALMPPGNEPVVLVGHSLGGPVVAQVAAEHPERVRAVVLLAASLDPGLEKIHPLPPLGKYWPIRGLLPDKLRNSNDELMDLKTHLMALEPLLKQVTAPVIIVHGTADDLVPFENVAFMQAKLTNARCLKTVVVDRQNHFLPWNSESIVRDAISWAIEAKC
jgi:pimeloyl-ACP methyl ester carboxylesterase